MKILTKTLGTKSLFRMATGLTLATLIKKRNLTRMFLGKLQKYWVQFLLTAFSLGSFIYAR